MLQIMDTRMGFPCPFCNVANDYFSPAPFIFHKSLILTSFKLYKAQHNDITIYGKVMLLAASWRHNILGVKWRCKMLSHPGWLDNISPDVQIVGINLSPVGETVILSLWPQATVLALLVKDQSSLCDTLSSYIHPSVNNILFWYLLCYWYRRDPFMVWYSWPHGLVVHVQFWSSPDPMGPHRGTESKNIFF